MASTASYISREYRCSCGKLLFRGILFKSRVDIKCLRCGHVQTLIGLTPIPVSDGCIFVSDKDGIIVEVTGNVRRLYGCHPDDIVGKHVSGFCANRSIAEDDREAALRCGDKRYLRLDLEHLDMSGDPLSVSVSYHAINQNMQKLVVRIINPALVQDDQHVPLCDFVCEVSERGDVLYVCSRSERCLGFRPIEIVGKNIASFYPMRGIDRKLRQFEILARKAASWRLPEYQLRRKDGTVVCCRAYCLPNIDEYGYLLGYRMLNWAGHTGNAPDKE